MSIDITGLEALVADLARAGQEAARGARQVVSRGALNIKRDWQANARASAGRYAPHYPASISYDLETTPVGTGAVIGPDKGGPQGALGNILEFGTSRQGGHNDGGRALAAEEPRFLAAIEEFGGGLL
ncbi:hypothetical protein ACGF07_25475 [Kitasatospora sp. NPDC048194]|uniref:hypothetical protein n=1 Tax=Kitasatospora sp. NPDC048194 TaxID=3364045 RepID=UPI003711358A